jgi:predicted esterase
MNHRHHGRRSRSLRQIAALFALVGFSGLLVAGTCEATRIVMKDGRIFIGAEAPLPSIAVQPKGASAAKTIRVIDDGLRRIFVPNRLIGETLQDTGEPMESFEIPQKVAEPGAGDQIGAVGPIFDITDFDEYGRRKLAMETKKGVLELIQGVTEVTPEWTKLECLDVPGMHYIWDMRIATNSIPRKMLATILAKQIDKTKLDHRLKIARLYIQSERFKDAEAELDGILEDFPQLSPNQRQLFEQTRVRLRQTGARRIVAEIETRKKSGQHELAHSLLQNFPTENIAGETLQQVSTLVKEHQQAVERRAEILKRFDEIMAKIKDSALKTRLAGVQEEIKKELNFNTLDRLAAFMQFQAEEEMSAEERIALAVSGWLGGSDFAVRNLPTAISMFEVRGFVNDYLRETSRKAGDVRLNELLAAMRRQEGFTPELVAKLLSFMKPPLPIKDEERSPKVVGQCNMQVNDIHNQVPIDYFVQLPAEYDPHRRYPTIVALHAATMSPQTQLEWWAGRPNIDGRRFGQADRHGYIVIAPAWAKEQQITCNYSEEEHGAVLYALRDAMRKFSIDTDRIYLAGHSLGAQIGWDIALAHPDIWAGFIGINPLADKTISLYQENARYVPTYLVFGEKDGALWYENESNLDHYLSNGLNTTVVQFKGRGHEHFSDELLRLFDWMGRQKRDPAPKDFKCRSIRYWDGSFWWVETQDPPEKAIVDPDITPIKVGATNHTSARVNFVNGIDVDTKAKSATVWLTPDLIDFKRPCHVRINHRPANKPNSFVEPDAAVMLEDARTRSDRMHPFWAKVESPR